MGYTKGLRDYACTCGFICPEPEVAPVRPTSRGAHRQDDGLGSKNPGCRSEALFLQTLHPGVLGGRAISGYCKYCEQAVSRRLQEMKIGKNKIRGSSLHEVDGG